MYLDAPIPARRPGQARYAPLPGIRAKTSILTVDLAQEEAGFDFVLGLKGEARNGVTRAANTVGKRSARSGSRFHTAKTKPDGVSHIFVAAATVPHAFRQEISGPHQVRPAVFVASRPNIWIR